MAIKITLMKIRGEADLLTAFKKYLKRKKLLRLYDFMYTNDDEKTAYDDFYSSIKAHEAKFIGRTYGYVKKLYDVSKEKAIPALANDPNRKKKAYVKAKIVETMVNDPRWHTIYIAAMEQIHSNLEALADDDFRKSKEFLAYLKSCVNINSLKNELEIEHDDNMIFDLVYATTFGQARDSQRLSKEIAGGHKPKKGSAMSPKKLVDAVRKAAVKRMPF